MLFPRAFNERVKKNSERKWKAKPMKKYDHKIRISDKSSYLDHVSEVTAKKRKELMLNWGCGIGIKTRNKCTFEKGNLRPYHIHKNASNIDSKTKRFGVRYSLGFMYSRDINCFDLTSYENNFSIEIGTFSTFSTLNQTLCNATNKCGSRSLTFAM